MLAFEFGNLCFTPSASEQEIVIVIAPRAEYSSLQAFIAAALAFLEWPESYKDSPNIPASDTDLDFIKTKIKEMDQRVHIVFQPVTKAVHIMAPQWNQVALGLETEQEYIFYSWITTV